MKKFFKNALLSMLFLPFSFLIMACNLGSSKQTPIYQGMEITSAVSSTTLQHNNHRLPYHGDCVDRNEHLDDNNSFGENIPDADDYIENNSIMVQGVGKNLYYADPNEDIYITIKISNPDSFEILSFTLNGKKYSNYMFEDGSDMENLVLKLNVGSESGIRDYTIDAIKYVDGKDIKDVIMNGEKVVRAGVRTTNLPNVNISNKEIELDSISFNIKLQDEYGLINFSNGDCKIYLYDGNEIIASKALTIGNQAITFDNLQANTQYQYVVMSNFDDLSGTGVGLHTLLKESFYTPTKVLFTQPTITQTSISWDYVWYESVESKVIVSQELLLDGIKVRTLDNTARQLTDLFSNRNYTIKSGYYNESNEIEYISLNFTTLAKAIPTIDIVDLKSSKDSISFDTLIADEDEILNIDKVELYRGETLVESYNNLDSKTFTNLEFNTKYDIVISYSYDLNYGNGIINTNVKKSYSTLAGDIIVTGLTVLNQSFPKVGEEVHVRVFFDNPSNIEIQSFYINGVEAKVDGGDRKTNAIVSFIPDFDGGIYQIEMTEIKYITNGIELSQVMNSIYSTEVLILGDIKVVSLGVNNDIGAFANYYSYLLLTLDNPTGYDVSEVVLADAYNNCTTYTDLVTINDNQLLISYENQASVGSNVVLELKSIKYGFKGGEYAEKTFSTITTKFMIGSLTSTKISTAEQLISMSANGTGTYELVNDIDLINIDWVPKKFSGTFIGNNFKIKNLTIAIENELTENQYFGLFSIFAGRIKDVVVENVYINVIAKSHCYFGGIAGHMNINSIADNCHVTGDINVNVEKDITVGGLFGYVAECQITNCSSKVNINVKHNYDFPSFIKVGGLLSGYEANATVNNSYSSGKISIESSKTVYLDVGGLACSARDVINCYSDVDISINLTFPYTPSENEHTSIYVGGLVENASFIKNCFYSGDIDIKSNNSAKIGGLSVFNSQGIKDSFVSGNISANRAYVGAIVEGSYKDKVDNCYYLNIINIDVENVLGEGISKIGHNASLSDIFEFTADTWDNNVWNFSQLELPKIKPIEIIKEVIEISSAEQLLAMRGKMYYGDYKLTKDIDLAGYTWIPFDLIDGTFDGNGFAIKNINIIESSKNSAFIAHANNAIIKNLTIQNINISYDGSFREFAIGGLVASGMNVNINNCHVQGEINVKVNSLFLWMGGLSGVLHYSTITGCSVDVDMVYDALSTEMYIDELIGMHTNTTIEQ